MALPVNPLPNGTHWRGPLLTASNAMGGNWENIPLGHIDTVRSRYKVWLETFNRQITAAIPTTSLPIANGWSQADLNTSTTPLFGVVVADRCAILDAGSKANSGYQVQDSGLLANGTLRATNTMGPLVGVDPVWDNTELIWAGRFGFRSDATAWDGIALVGIFVTDTSMFSTTTGVPTIATGGGFGFHVGITGTITALGAQTAITAVPSTTTGFSILALDTAAVFNWVDLGFRVRFGDTSTGVGTADYYVNGRKVVTITTGLPTMATTYSNTLAICNGAAQLSDLGIDYLYTAVTGAGRTNTSA